MRIMATAGYILLLWALAALIISSADSECSACKGGSATAQQDVLNSEWAVFLGKENASPQVVTSSNGLVSPQLSRQSNPSLISKSDPSQSTGSQNTGSQSTGEAANSGGSSGRSANLQRSYSSASALVPLNEANSSGIIIDISPNSTEYIPGAINIPYTWFLKQSGALLPISEIAQVLGDAGVSEYDPVLIYGECQPCGGGPSAATYVYWLMKYLGHEKLKLLDGGIDEWVKDRQPTVAKPQSLAKKNYIPRLNASLLATYEYVHSKTPQVVDARTAAEFEAGAIPDAINIPYDSVIDGKRIKDEAALRKLFEQLRLDRPVVVYTNTGVKASIVWFALNSLGYDARLYSWQDWLASRPKLPIDLLELRAQPNPAKTGDAVQITAVFQEENQSLEKGQGNEPASASGNETVLIVQGCATCGFGSPQGFADLTKTGGVVQIGSTSQAGKNAENNGFKVTAVVKGPDGAEVSRVILKRISGDEFTGFWNANVASGVYKVDIIASAGEISKTFAGELEIEVATTSKYKNLGN